MQIPLVLFFFKKSWETNIFYKKVYRNIFGHIAKTSKDFVEGKNNPFSLKNGSFSDGMSLRKWKSLSWISLKKNLFPCYLYDSFRILNTNVQPYTQFWCSDTVVCKVLEFCRPVLQASTTRIAGLLNGIGLKWDLASFGLILLLF